MLEVILKLSAILDVSAGSMSAHHPKQLCSFVLYLQQCCANCANTNKVISNLKQ